MFRIPRAHPWPPTLDLSTVRETLHYMRDDARRIPGLEGLADALDKAMAEAEQAERRSEPVTYSPIVARFLPKRM